MTRTRKITWHDPAEARLENEDGTLYAHASSTWLISNMAEKKQQLAA